ncbi:MAG TPA: aquaporin [Ramlibacter sp.]|jgi:glycerol uptake facilitator-like aquaporin|uniref:aquaporin n=1 Tax=Ramlibacter sp. TaxID=1917967 RepID=UPI002D2F7364|nr:aquaporin [Ramlibacter sp.]HZY19108.1 aquaporin [Ramlibacter sp.]
MSASRARRPAEFLGTALLLTAVIASGIMGENLAAGNAAVALLANTLTTVFALLVLLEVLGPIGGAHVNPVVTIAFGRQAGLAVIDRAFIRRKSNVRSWVRRVCGYHRFYNREPDRAIGRGPGVISALETA